jgi:MarR family transcriptional regulator, transcriptional regulator for hemolysin
MAPSDYPSLAQLINRVSRALTRQADAALEPLGLRYAQVPVLALLRDGEQMTQTALAAATGIEQPSMAQLLARMERDELIQRVPNPRDARSRTIVVTPGSTKQLDQGHEALIALNQVALQGFTSVEIHTLGKLLLRVKDNLDNTTPCRGIPQQHLGTQ